MSLSLDSWAAISFRAVRLSQLVSRESLEVEEGRTGEWKLAGNLSGVAGEEGEKRRCRLSRGGGVSHRGKQRGLVGDGLGVRSEALIS